MPATYTFLLKIGGVDVSTYGLYVSTLPDNWDTPVITFDEVAIPGQDGTIQTTNEPTIEPKDYLITCRLIGSSASDFESKLDTVKYLIAGNTSAVVQVIAGNQTTRQRAGVCKNVKTVIDPDVMAATVTIVMRCRNPINYETSDTTITGTTNTDLACALGTFRSWPVLTVASPSSPLVVTYKNYSGTTIAAMTITFPGSPTTVVIDTSLKTVTVDSVRHDDYITAMTGNGFFRLDPRDGDLIATHYPTIRVSSGTPSHVYKKAWL